MSVLNAYGDFNQRTSATDDPAPDQLRDGTRKPAGWKLNGSDGGHYRNRTHEQPRPTAADFSSPNQLAEQQRDWDRAEFSRRWQVQIDRDYQHKCAAEKAERERIRTEEDAKTAAAKRAQLLEPARRAYVAAGGTEDGWAEAEADIAGEILKREAVQAVTNPGIAPLVSKHNV